MPKSPTASKREVRTALHVAANTGQAMAECVEAIQRLAQTGEGLAGIVEKEREARLTFELAWKGDVLIMRKEIADLKRRSWALLAIALVAIWGAW
jgi:hypothetical protein